ncbi:unnamed protein product, partial [Amoebophrya sp. A25]
HAVLPPFIDAKLQPSKSDAEFLSAQSDSSRSFISALEEGEGTAETSSESKDERGVSSSSSSSSTRSSVLAAQGDKRSFEVHELP